MPGTYAGITLHVVFSTKGREPWITDLVAPRLHEYMGGIVREMRGTSLGIGGVEDHVHMMVGWRTDETIATLMRTVKSRSSRWTHETFPELDAFAWQEGYAVFSVSASNVESVRRYIASQEAHHAKFDFKTELVRLLEAHRVEYDRRYVFD